jgi:hypothetical protein
MLDSRQTSASVLIEPLGVSTSGIVADVGERAVLHESE